MKFRTDFVTNSSSSNFMSVTLNLNNSTEEEFSVFEEGTGWNNFIKYSEDEGLTFLGYPIKTLDELFACLYLYYNGDDMYEINIIPILTPIFQFIARKIDSAAMIEIIHDYTQENDITLDWYPFDELENFSSDDYDDEDQLRDEIENTFSCGSEELIESYSKLSKKNISLSDIESLVFYDNCRDYGEFLNHFSEDVYYDSYIKNNFPQVDKDDPLFEKEVTKWTDIFYERIFEVVPGKKEIEFDNDIDIEAGLESGDLDDCIGDLEGANTHKWVTIILNPNKKSEEMSSTTKKSEYKLSEEDTSEHDYYFEIFNCLSEFSYYPPKYLVEKLKEITEEKHFPKCFHRYPITDILENISKYASDKVRDALKNVGLEMDPDEIFNHIFDESWDSLYTFIEKSMAEKGESINRDDILGYFEPLRSVLNILPGLGIKLDFADVSHYIYNDSIETIYPLFEKGVKIEKSAFDELSKYAVEHGKEDFSAWLMDNKDNISAN